MDLSMELGIDFVEHINKAVGSCRLLVAVIGPRWASTQDAHGRRRLDDPADFIRVEVETGLRRPEVRVVPVLVQGARMPDADELPASLAELARRNALEVSDARWHPRQLDEDRDHTHLGSPQPSFDFDADEVRGVIESARAVGVLRARPGATDHCHHFPP